MPHGKPVKQPDWNVRVLHLLRGGETPVVTLSPSARVKSQPGPVGRPKSPWPLMTPGGNRVRCRKSGCRGKVKAKYKIACSERCASELREECELLLGILDGEVHAEELPLYMRTNKLKRKMTG